MSQAGAYGVISGQLIGTILIMIGLTRLLLWLLGWVRWPVLRILMADVFALVVAFSMLATKLIRPEDGGDVLSSLVGVVTCLLLIIYDLIVTRRKYAKIRAEAIKLQNVRV